MIILVSLHSHENKYGNCSFITPTSITISFNLHVGRQAVVKGETLRSYNDGKERFRSRTSLTPFKTEIGSNR